MSAEADRLRHLLRTVTECLNKRSMEYDESQRALFAARNELRSKQAEVDGLTWQVSELQAENAKLHELVIEMHDDLAFADYYLRDIGRTVRPKEYASRMRELGIEVDA